MEILQVKLLAGLVGLLLVGLAAAIVTDTVWLGVAAGVPLILFMSVDFFDSFRGGGESPPNGDS